MATIIQREGAGISYQLTGSGDITLLFIHGSYTDRTWWKTQVEYFSGSYRILTLDLPGHGQSGTERKHWSIDGFSKDVISVIEQSGVGNIILIGHSMGAAVGLMAVVSRPELFLGLVAVEYFKNAGTVLPAEYQKQSRDMLERLKTGFRNANEQYARMALLTEKTSPVISKRVVEAYRNAFEPMGMATTPELFEMYRVEQKLLPQLPFKLYIINADYMPTNEAALRQYAGSGYELFSMEGTSHFPMLENPALLNELLGQAVKKISADISHAHT